MTTTKATTTVAQDTSSKKGTISGTTAQARTSIAAYTYAVDASGVRLTRREYEEFLASRLAN